MGNGLRTNDRQRKAAKGGGHEDLKTIVQSLGMVLIIIGILTVIPLLVAAFYNEDMLPFFFVSVIPMISGMISVRFMSPEIEFQARHAAIAAALTYLIVSLLGTIPFTYYGMGLLDSFFESMSGWTTTGLTMISDVETMPKSLLFWRSFMQWLGGVGVIVLLLAILSTGRASLRLYQAEARKERIKPRLVSTARLIWWIYIVYTLVGIFLFFIAGMSTFEATNHSMTAISTGGFSVKNASFAAYNSFEIEIVGMFLMLLGGVNFYVHYKFLTGDKGFLFRDLQVKAMIAIIIISTLLIGLTSLSFRNALFQSVSALTNAGLSTADVSVLDDFSKSVLSLLMIIGGSAGSTSGALKIIRVVIILKLIYWWIKQTLLPEHAVFSRRLDGVELGPDIAQEAAVFSLLYFVILGAGALSLMYLGYSGADSVFEVAAAQGNVGLSSGVTSSVLDPWGKIVLIFNMWVGRLEIIPVLVLGQSLFGFRRI
jgi:trk system potassium uptake protein TrkH